ncbi:MAG: immunoglobulin-like domain-containing protein [Thiolinea sp.]
MNRRVQRLALFISFSAACLGSSYSAIAADPAATENTSQTERARPPRDRTPPVITLYGDSTVTVTQYSNFNDPGARATDAVDGRVSVHKQGRVNESKIGTYTISYRATDRAGNTATVVRTVHVVADTVAPTISLRGEAEITLVQGTRYRDLGVSASDNSGVVRVSTEGQVNTRQVGVYTLTYTARDRSGNESTVTRTVTVVSSTPVDTIAPVISLNGSAAVELMVGETYTDAGATATDNVDTTVTVTTTSTVETTTAGSYTVTYNATDAAGNAATPVIRTVVVNPIPNVAPTANAGGDQTVNEQTTVTLNGSGTDTDGTIATYTWTQVSGPTVTLSPIDQVQATFTAPDVTADTELTFKLTVTDDDGATAEDDVKVLVKLVDSTKPVITLNGEATVELTVGDAYVDAGATATDDVDGSINVTTTGSVDTTAAGTYILTYSATDTAGNVADTLTRTVIVVAAPQPVLGLNDTGVLTCANATMNDLTCPVDGYPNQDAQSGRDLDQNDAADGDAGFSFTKLDTAGNALTDQTVDYATNPWACVKDNVTGLVWEVKTSDNGLRDKNWTYSWYEPNRANGGIAGYATAYSGNSCDQAGSCNTSAYTARVNTSNLCGYSDWRLPTTEELYGITSLQTQSIDTAYFTNTVLTNTYWGAETFAPSADLAWRIGKTQIEYMTKGQASLVRLVRGQ